MSAVCRFLLDNNRKSGYIDIFSEKESMKETAAFFKVLADEARLKMLWLLFNHRELCVCDFIEVLAITQSKASRHLRILYRAGLVTDRREGLWVYYALGPCGTDWPRAIWKCSARIWPGGPTPLGCSRDYPRGCVARAEIHGVSENLLPDRCRS